MRLHLEKRNHFRQLYDKSSIMNKNLAKKFGGEKINSYFCNR